MGLVGRWHRFADAERVALPLWLPVAFGIGIAAWFLIGQGSARAACALLMGGGALGGALLGWRVPALVCALALAGMGAAEWRSARVAHAVLAAPDMVMLTGRIDRVERRAGSGEARLLIAPDDGALPPLVRVTLRGALAVPPAAGARVRLRAMLAPPAGPVLPGGQDTARRAWFAGIGATGFAIGPVQVLAPPPPRQEWLAGARLVLHQRILARLPGERGGVAAALVTGDQGDIPQPTLQAMRDSGLAHLLSISGLHIAVVVGGTVWLARRLLALSPWLALRWPLRTVATAIGAAAGIAYTLLAGAEVPTVRSILATLIVLLGMAVGREALSLRLLAAAALIILAVRPEALLGPSFQLSFAAVIAIVALYESRLGRWLVRVPEDEGLLHRFARHGAGLLASGLVAELALSGIGLFHFGQSGLYGVLANLAAIPLAAFAVMPALVLALAGEVAGIAAGWAVAGWTIGLVIAIADWAAALPGAVLRLPAMPVPAFAALVAGGLWLTLWRSRARWWGVAAVAAGLAGAMAAPLPDLIVSGDGRHALLRLADGRAALLRERVGGYVADSWAEGLGIAAEDLVWIGATPAGRCTADACVATLQRGGRRWRILATTSRDFIDRPAFEAACAGADIAISDRRLPRWCRPRWLRLDRAALANSGAVAVRLDKTQVVTVADAAGDHPWRQQGQGLSRGPRTGRMAGQTGRGGQHAAHHRP